MEHHEKKALQQSIYIPLAKVYFVITGYCIYFGLSRILTPAQFGVYGVVIGLVSILNGVFITGTVQGVSKFISEDESRAEAVKKSAFILQGLIGGLAFVVMLLFARQIAGALNDESLYTYIRTASFIFLFYAFYAVFIGHLNGVKNFKLQGILDISYSTIKLALVLILAGCGLGVLGAIKGFAFAALIILLVAFLTVGYKGGAPGFPIKQLLAFEIPIMVFVLIQNLIINSDLMLIKALTEKSVSSVNAGLYTACLSIARVPFMITTSLGYIIFPFISKATRVKQIEKARSYIFQGVRLCLVISALFCILFSSTARETLLLVYPATYSQAAGSLQILTIGYFFFSLFIIAITTINSSGKPLVSMLIGFLVLLCQVAANLTLIPRYGILGAAIGTTMAQFLGVIVAGAYIYHRFGVFIPAKSAARIALISLLAYGASLLVPLGGILLVAKDIIIVMLFIALLIISGEFSKTELASVKDMLTRRGEETQEE